MTVLWICEKYSVACELAHVLFDGIASHSPPVIVTKQAARLVYTNGHVLELAAPELYDPAYKSWERQDIAGLVQNGFRLVAAAGKSSALCALATEIRAASEIVVATDAGREGEMIAWEILDHAGFQGPVRRFWTSSLTDGALRKAAAELLPGARTVSLYHAGRARSRADWIEGLTYTRYFTRHHTAPRSKPLSVGRVQSAVAALVEDRCREIQAFAAQTYFDVKAVIATPSGSLELTYHSSSDQRIEDPSEAQALASRMIGRTVALSIKTLPKAAKPVDFLSTSGAQKRAFSLWQWSLERTLDLLQKLYEAKLITYPRTECTHLSADHAQHMPSLLRRLAALPEIAALARAHPDWIETPVIRSPSYDDSKLTDHHAIIPTGMIPDLARLPPDEAKLYQLVMRHAVANLLPDHLYDSTTVTAELDGKIFFARGRTTREPGWRSLIAEDRAEREVKGARKNKQPAQAEEPYEDMPVQLPPIKDGCRGAIREAAILKKQTKPSAYFTQASLLDAMVNIDLYMDAPSAKRVLGGPSPDRKLGIGTGATRAHIVRTLFDRGYIEEHGTAIHATQRGSAFIGLARRLVPWMIDPFHSAELEAALREIEAGKSSDGTYVSDVINRTQQTLSKLLEMGDATRIEDEPDPNQRQPRPARRSRRGRAREPLTAWRFSN